MLKASFPGVITMSLFISLSVSGIEWNICEISILCQFFKERKGKPLSHTHRTSKDNK